MNKELGENFVGLFTDPGEVHTGYVIARLQPREFHVIEAGEVNGANASADLLERAVNVFGAIVWVYEGFRLYAHKKDVKTWSEFPEIETIGQMKQAARYVKPPLHIFKQYASQIKITPYEDKALQTAGLNLRLLPSVHTRDALRHLILFWGHYPTFYPNTLMGRVTVLE